MSTYIRLIWAYFKIGLFGFGGGYAMLSLIENEVVQTGWITPQQFTDIVAISQMTPGPIGINSATYIGYTVSGAVWGSVLTTLMVVLPPFILVYCVAKFITNHHESPIIKGAFQGLRPVIVGLIASAALLLMNSDNFGYEFTHRVISILIFTLAFILVYFKKLHPIIVIVLSGIMGLFLF